MADQKIVLCDTNILIDFYKGDPAIKNQLAQIGQSNIRISDVTTGELYFGARNKTELGKLKKSLAALGSLPITALISQKALDLLEQYTLSHSLNLPDALIAATALIHDVELFTLNRKDFQYLPDLVLFEPTNTP